jgi:magnesium transporter
MPKNTYLRSQKTGLAPGIPVYIGDRHAQTTSITVIGYDDNNVNITKECNTTECIITKNKSKVTWIRVTGLSDIKTITDLCEGYGIHPLVIEDIFNTKQRPKVDVFENYIFVTLRPYDYDQEKNAFVSEQISLIIGKNFIITLQETDNKVFDLVLGRLQAAQNIMRKKGPDYLAHALLDVVVDGYFKIIEIIGDKIEELEDKLTNRPDAQIIKEIHAIRRDIIFLRKTIWPLREVISALQHRIGNLITDETALYLRDVYEHTIQVIDTVETYRDFLAEMFDIYLSSVSNKLNEVMKVLTVFASIFIPLTFVTSLYGMNFNPAISPYNMPELNMRYGYVTVVGVMVIMAIMMLIYFKRKKWW